MRNSRRLGLAGLCIFERIILLFEEVTLNLAFVEEFKVLVFTGKLALPIK